MPVAHLVDFEQTGRVKELTGGRWEGKAYILYSTF